MKSVLYVVSMVICSWGMTLFLKDGSVIEGNPICETKSILTLKENGAGTVSVVKKNIARVDTISLEGKREFMVGDSAMVKAKNELLLKNSSSDSCIVRLRGMPEGKCVREILIAPGQSPLILLENGSFFETVRYWRSAGEYYSQGQPFIFDPKCDSYQKYEIVLKGCVGDKIPQLKGPKIAYERE